ncbi:hypothetical protein RIF29_05753 [Crotalaria pallida]|uniref:Uncharacterized protein n=1 Tax=Crotalaria pallida TaxID=3830 RepID=A0AAN9J2J1_CROPI
MVTVSTLEVALGRVSRKYMTNSLRKRLVLEHKGPSQPSTSLSNGDKEIQEEAMHDEEEVAEEEAMIPDPKDCSLLTTYLRH